MTKGVNPFAISETLEDFILWCNVDPESVSFDQAIEWSIIMEEWDLFLHHSLRPTACVH